MRTLVSCFLASLLLVSVHIISCNDQSPLRNTSVGFEKTEQLNLILVATILIQERQQDQHGMFTVQAATFKLTVNAVLTYELLWRTTST